MAGQMLSPADSPLPILFSSALKRMGGRGGYVAQAVELLDSLGFSPIEEDPYFLDVVIRARQLGEPL